MKCPGQDSRYWIGDFTVEVPCPECGTAVEIFRDESAGRCPGCGHRFLNPGRDFRCAQWCSLTQECLGYVPERPTEPDSQGAIAARLIQWAQRQFSNNGARLARVFRVFQHAKELLHKEGGNPRVVLSAAILLAAGVQGSGTAPHPPEKGGPSPDLGPWLDDALSAVNLDQPTLEQVQRLVESCQRGEDLHVIESQIVSDSCTLARFATEPFTGSADEWESVVQKSLRTETARNRARSLFST